jgi:hypothetical protein
MDKLGDDPCNTRQTAAAPGDQAAAEPGRAGAWAGRWVKVASQPAVLELAHSPLIAISTFAQKSVSAVKGWALRTRSAPSKGRCRTRAHQDLNGRAGSTHRQDDLAFGVAGLQVGNRLLGLSERIDAVNDDFELLGFDK